MAFLSVKPAKVEHQLNKLNSLLDELHQSKQSLREVQTRLTEVQANLAQSLIEKKAAYLQLSVLAAPALENRFYVSSRAKFAHKTMQRMDNPNAPETKIKSEVSHRYASETINSLISKIDSQATLIALMKHQIIKPRLLRGKSTAQLMSGINQQVDALRWNLIEKKVIVESSIGVMLVESSNFSNQAFDIRNEVRTLQTVTPYSLAVKNKQMRRFKTA